MYNTEPDTSNTLNDGRVNEMTDEFGFSIMHWLASHFRWTPPTMHESGFTTLRSLSDENLESGNQTGANSSAVNSAFVKEKEGTVDIIGVGPKLVCLFGDRDRYWSPL